MFESERLLYRKFVESDYPFYTQWYQDSNVMQYISGHPLDDKACRARFDQMILDNQISPHFGLFIIFHKSDQSFFGIGRLSRVDQHVLEIGYGLFPSHWRQGYGGEIMDRLFDYALTFPSTQKIIGITDSRNVASIKILERHGMKLQKQWTNDHGSTNSQYMIEVRKNTRDGYKIWSKIYDSNENKTRDLEKEVCQQYFLNKQFDHVLEIGCGTGKNTSWLMDIAENITAIDFSEEMLEQARSKIQASHVQFIRMDIKEPWELNGSFDLITCSLVLEHLQNLQPIFSQISEYLKPGGQFYIGELHPYKYLKGSRARFEKDLDVVHVESYVHHISDFLKEGQTSGLNLILLDEWFDDTSRQNPRLISLLFRK